MTGTELKKQIKDLQKLGKQKKTKEAMALKDARIGDREKRAAGNTDKIAVNEKGATTGY